MNKLITLSSEISLKPFSQSVTQNYLTWFNDPIVNRYLNPKLPKTDNKIRQWIKKVQKPPYYYYSIFHQNQNIGHIGIKPSKFDKQLPECAIIIGEPKCWGKGIASIAVEWAKNKAQSLNHPALIARVNKKNIGSLKVFTKLNFKKISESDPIYQWFKFTF